MTTSTLFRNQKGSTVDVCHDVGHMSYDNDLCNRTRLNQSIESWYQNSKETTCSALFHRKFSKVSSWYKNIPKVPFGHNTLLSINNTKYFRYRTNFYPAHASRIIGSRLHVLLRNGYGIGGLMSA